MYNCIAWKVKCSMRSVSYVKDQSSLLEVKIYKKNSTQAQTRKHKCDNWRSLWRYCYFKMFFLMKTKKYGIMTNIAHTSLVHVGLGLLRILYLDCVRLWGVQLLPFPNVCTCIVLHRYFKRMEHTMKQDKRIGNEELFSMAVKQGSDLAILSYVSFNDLAHQSSPDNLPELLFQNWIIKSKEKLPCFSRHASSYHSHTHMNATRGISARIRKAVNK